MKNTIISLNGRWDIEYISESAYTNTKEPITTSARISVADAVPKYFEDMENDFASAAFKDKIAINPLYERQAYPMTSYAPDMALPNFVGAFAYRRTFTVDRISADAKLWFGGVQNRVFAWINGIYIGRHEGYSSDFSMDIPSGAIKARENTITLAVSNTRLTGYMDRPVSGLTSRAANECTGGIYGDVELRLYENGLYDVWVSTANDTQSFTVNIVGNPCTEREITILDGEKELTRVTISRGECSAKISAAGYTLWTPDEPKLYIARVSDCEGNIFTRRFGIRRLTADGTKLHLNGKPYFFRGICEHCYHPITVHPTRDKNYYANVIKTVKNLGFNSIRFHTYVPPCEYMEAADEVGIVVEIETPNNTAYEEWLEIVKMARRYTSPMIYSSGNEMIIDEDYIEHLRKVADFVHNESDSLFSPMSAMRGVEYFSYGDCQVDEPFPHNPKRLAALSEFCDLYNTYSLGLTSYNSTTGEKDILNTRNAIYKKPLLSHEICIHGTYCDLSLKKRYKGTKIGKTEIFTSVEKHLSDVGLIDRADLYYKNSVKWQMQLRKNCFELMRRTESFAGYDFLGDIDTHWHTFGYCVGMMNEFYELKPGESTENVRRYNSDIVLLADLPQNVNLSDESKVEIPILVSNFGEEIKDSVLKISLKTQHGCIFNKEIVIPYIPIGKISELYTLSFAVPRVKAPEKLIISVSLDNIAGNEWELYAYPKQEEKSVSSVSVSYGMEAKELFEALSRGEKVLIFGTSPFPREATSYQISLAGRTNGHLATVISSHKLTERLAHDGFLGEQFKHMLNGGNAAILDLTEIPFEPIIEIATSYKNAHREALLFEYKVGNGKLLVCTLNLTNADPGAVWLKNEIISYAESENFEPKHSITEHQLAKILGAEIKYSEKNTNEAMNKNDITAN